MLVVLALAIQARANIVINASFDSTIANDPNAATIEAGINAMIARVEADIANNITVNITYAETNSGLGGSSSTGYDVGYSTYLSRLHNNQILSTSDTTALATLPGGSANPVNGSTQVQVPAALANALGIVGGPASGTVYLNTSIMNLSRTGPQNPNDYDLQSVAGHETDELLGIGGPGSALYLNGSYTGQAPPTGPVGVLDLFRYASPGVRSFTLDPTVNAYFSINGGYTNLVYFDQNNEGADFSDWGNGIPDAQYGNSPPQLQDSFGSPGTDINIGGNELTALDVEGYNLTPAGAVAEPEPSTLVLLLTAAGTLLLGYRRMRNRTPQANHA